MNIYYNPKGIGDTLLITKNTGDRKTLSYDKKEDVVRIYHIETNELLGYNIFNISNKVAVEGIGPISFDETLVNQLNQIIQEQGFNDLLEYSNEPDFVVGFVKKKEKHPNADKLSICQVDVGGKELQIVCGAPNVDEGQKVVVARVGAVMPSGMVIKDAELRGVQSSGMICSAKELDLPNAPQEKGILVLADDSLVGDAFFEKE